MRFKKSVLTGALALSVLAGAGSAYAAPSQPSNIGNEALNPIYAGSGFSLNDWIRSLQEQGWNVRVVYPQWSWHMPNTDYGSGNGSYNGGQGSNNGAATGTETGAGTGSDAGQAGNAGNAGNGAGSEPAGNAGETATTASAYADQVVSLVNQERAKAGLSPLASDPALTKMALDKAKDMYNNNYFDHNSPTYGSPFDMMKAYGISYSYAGENIAKGQRNPQEVMNAWMNSAGHRQNILSPNFTKIGVAYYNGEWVQEFIAN
ncbi:CAP domain-containing protein [Paenibacillus sp. GYB003]|uniref:CAP domain-containing protein n=1 Tax=Paenibacillus sp. GYB003 TaxID=2994392 RepID=UPI002F969656